MRLSLTDRILNPVLSDRAFVRRGKPPWLKMQLPHSPRYAKLKQLVTENRLHTVCQEAACPNMGECWSNGVATVMILGDTCTRSCGFCNIKTGRPTSLDLDEPARAADAIRIMGLSYVVITSVNRDELPDGGAAVWAETIRRTRDAAPDTKIEVLIPDFCGNTDALDTVLDAKPDVLAHNMETVRRLQRAVRPQARYERSIGVLRHAKQRGFIVKTGFMVGLGETDDEVIELIRDVIDGTRVSNLKSEISRRPALRSTVQHNLKSSHCDIMSIGQYLQPSPKHLPVARFVHPDAFAHFKQVGESLGVTHIESGPMVRSSYHADKQAASARQAACA